MSAIKETDLYSAYDLARCITISITFGCGLVQYVYHTGHGLLKSME